MIKVARYTEKKKWESLMESILIRFIWYQYIIEHTVMSFVSLAIYSFTAVISRRGLNIPWFFNLHKGNRRKYFSSRNASAMEKLPDIQSHSHRSCFLATSSESNVTLRIQRGPWCKSRSQWLLSVKTSTLFLLPCERRNKRGNESVSKTWLACDWRVSSGE